MVAAANLRSEEIKPRKTLEGQEWEMVLSH